MTKIIHSWLSGLLAATLALTAVCFVACGETDKKQEDVRIELSKTEIELYVGESVRLTASVTPADAKDKTIGWRTSDKEIATVDDGVVTGVKAGETTVTAYTGEQSVACKVVVREKSDGGSDGGLDGSSGGSESVGDDSASDGNPQESGESASSSGGE